MFTTRTYVGRRRLLVVFIARFVVIDRQISFNNHPMHADASIKCIFKRIGNRCRYLVAGDELAHTHTQ
jgi:hypothetical protein